MRYHEYLLKRMKEDRQMQLDLFPKSQPHFPCAHCGELVHRDEVVIKTKETGQHSSQQNYFCSLEHSRLWYLDQVQRF